MKNYKFKYTMLGLMTMALSFTSCEDNFTEIDRGFILIEDTIENIDDVERLMAGAYNSLTYTTVFSRNSIASDEVRIGLGNRGQGLQEHSHTLTAGDGGPTGLWNSSYNTIDNLNRVLAFLDNITIADEDQARATSLRGQAQGLRAMTYFDLLRAFAVDMNPSSPGVILTLETLVFGESDLSQPRATVGEVLIAINDDLEDAAALIPVDLNSNYEFFNRNAVAAQRARLALYTGAYQDAIDYATVVINNVPALQPNAYFDMFRLDGSPDDGSATETIFQLEVDEVDNGAIGAIWTATNQDVFFSMSSGLFSEMQDEGIRFNLNLDLEDEITDISATGDEIVVGKFIGRSEALPSRNHVRVFRTSEMILIRAEANARLNNFMLAQTEIEDFRALRGSFFNTPDYNDVTTATLDILRERRVELAFEGHRLFDLKRFNLPVQRDDADCNDPTRAAPTSCTLEADSFRFTYPIPQSELFANPGINDEDQNPGY